MPAAANAADPLLAAIVADPDDDTARLAYADYLEEEGRGERGEFIRVQVELARLPAWDRKAKLLRFRERQLLIRNGETWRSELPRFPGGDVAWGRFERGFVAEVTVPSPAVLMKRWRQLRAVSPVTGAALVDTEGVGAKGVKELPWLRALRIRAATGGLSETLGGPLAAHLTTLVCDGGSDLLAREIATAKGLSGLRELAVLTNGWAVTDRGVAALAHAKHLAGLRVLRLPLMNVGGYVADPHLSTNGIRTLASSPYLTNLTTLDVGHQRFTADAVRAVLTSPTFAKLETVSFAGAPLTASAFELPDGPVRLRDVNLGQCVIRDAGAGALARSPQFSAVGRLNVSSCEIGGSGLAALANSPLAATVCDLDLSDNPVRSLGMEQFARGTWPELHTLNLSTCGLGPETMKPFQAATGIGKLLDLNLSNNEVAAAGAIAAARADWAGEIVRLNLAKCRCAAGAVLGGSAAFHRVEQLDLTDNPLNPVGVESLMEGEWPALAELRLSGSGAGDDGVRAVARSAALARLVVLSLSRCGVTADGLACLLANRPADGPGSRLVQLDLSRNPGLGDEAVHVLLRSPPPELRFLTIACAGLTPPALDRLSGTPLLAKLARLDWAGNQASGQMATELYEASRRPLGPDWEALGLPIPTV